MAAITSLVPDVRAVIPDIPSFVAQRQLLRAARTFCQDTRAWRVNFPLSVVGSVPTVSLAAQLPDNTELVDIISIKNVGGGEPLTATTYSRLDLNKNTWQSEEQRDAKYYVLEENNLLRLVPSPAETVAALYNIRVAVKPLRTATEIGDVLANKFDEDLINGALSFLFLVTRKPWPDLQLGLNDKAQFLNSIPGARAAAADEFQVGVGRKIRYGGL